MNTCASATPQAPDVCELPVVIAPHCGFASPEDVDVLDSGAVLVVGGFKPGARHGSLRGLIPVNGSVKAIAIRS